MHPKKKEKKIGLLWLQIYSFYNTQTIMIEDKIRKKITTLFEFDQYGTT
jgi:glycine betaine/choline ABC-type transport system substrate-binding protein